MTGDFSDIHMLTRTRTWLLAIAIVAMMTNTRAAEHSYSPPDGFVPDATTAIAIAEAVLIPIYGRAEVEAERPFSASLKGGDWTVLGHQEANQTGGAALVVIDKSSGRIVRVSHGR